MNLAEIFYRHDGAPACYAQSIGHFLDENLPNRWVGRLGPINWLARSLNLTLRDFFLWDVIKDRVYATKPQNLEALKAAIITKI